MIEMRALSLLLVLLLTGCASVYQIGEMGPKRLPVFVAKSDGLLTASRVIVILDENGNVAAAPSGSTSAGWGPSVANLAGSVVMGAGIAYAGRSLSDAIRNINLTAGGGLDLKPSCPSTIPNCISMIPR